MDACRLGARGDAEQQIVPAEMTARDVAIRIKGVSHEFGEPGEYDLKDALIHTNGDIRIYADSKTRVKMRGETFGSRIGRLFTTQVW